MAEQRNLGSMLCPNCGKLISATADKCIHCGAGNPSMWGLASVLQKLFGSGASLIPIITVVCIGLYVFAILLDIGYALRPSHPLALLGPNWQVLDKMGAAGSFRVFGRGEWWRLITAIYLHGGILHIFFNVLWIRQLGPVVEELFGVSRSFLIFTIAGIAGFLLSTYMGVFAQINKVTLGASGSIFGLLGALIYYGRKRGGTFGTAIYRQMGQWALVLFVLGFVISGVDNFAHGGGFVGGYLAASWLGFSESKSENRVHTTAALIAMVLTVLAFLLSWFGS